MKETLYRYNEHSRENVTVQGETLMVTSYIKVGFCCKATKPNFPLIVFCAHISDEIYGCRKQSIKGKFYQTGQARKSTRRMPWH